ncbi:TetR family transcriptional regulator [Mycobacterium antarcticum]|uniref:TetR/AcrR family transcriptional regulator n=1 Tax=Mycolicibacterium sp. TUM20983 TaxID=3023369 RepID=UPI00238BAE49|nr:TetR/AcrR family transcriptional regulator [Mycolicibacterium sp. TUM20983]GLP77988.1 TetR family transcriptional regulator [Mycolicibacterium sp. TUM20983]
MTEPPRQQATGRRRRRTRTGTDLSQEVYVDAAVNLIERRGAAVLSARTLGAAVGAHPSALYRYFAGVDDVLRAVADRMIGIGLQRWSPAEDWLSSLANLARALHGVYVYDFPRAGYALANRTTGLPNEIRAVELTLGLLVDGGFDNAAATKCFVVMSDFLLGQAMLGSAVVTLPSEIRDADDGSWVDLTKRLPATTPHTEAAAPHLRSMMVQSSFEASLQMMLRGLAASPRT